MYFHYFASQIKQTPARRILYLVSSLSSIVYVYVYSFPRAKLHLFSSSRIPRRVLDDLSCMSIYPNGGQKQQIERIKDRELDDHPS